MMCWCKQCRKWVYEQHFQIEGKDCDGRDRGDIRYHPSRPLCGDVWLLKGGQWTGKWAVIDYLDPFCTGITITDGSLVFGRLGLKYTDSVRQLFESTQAELVSTFEEVAYPRGIDHRGWTDPKYQPDAADRDGSRSAKFLKGLLEAMERAKAANENQAMPVPPQGEIT